MKTVYLVADKKESALFEHAEHFFKCFFDFRPKVNGFEYGRPDPGRGELHHQNPERRAMCASVVSRLSTLSTIILFREPEDIRLTSPSGMRVSLKQSAFLISPRTAKVAACDKLVETECSNALRVHKTITAQSLRHPRRVTRAGGSRPASPSTRPPCPSGRRTSSGPAGSSRGTNTLL